MGIFPSGNSSITLFRAAVGQWPFHECERERAKNEQCFLSCSHNGCLCPRSQCPPFLSVVSRCCAATRLSESKLPLRARENGRCSRKRTSDALSAASFFFGHSHHRITLSRPISLRVISSRRFMLRNLMRDGALARVYRAE